MVLNMEYLIVWTFFALVGALIGQSKGRTTAGVIFGLLVGPIGWLIVAIGPNLKPKCPECGGVIVAGARKCKNCGSTLKTKPGEPTSLDPLQNDPLPPRIRKSNNNIDDDFDSIIDDVLRH